MVSLVSLRKIGPKSAYRLRSASIQTAEEFYEVGVVEAYLRAKAAFPEQVSVNFLFAFQGALMELSWNEIPPDIKQKLLSEIGLVEA
jgi:DNA transformation protein